MTNKFVLKLLSLVLVIVMLSGALFACFDYPAVSDKTDDWAEYPSDHKDIDNDGYCDDCNIDVVI